ncbi:unnamed protein product [Peronospora destructor]|uniref:HIG1 domain-containing protein n=1 Tax=Peronospora destructor TaxID=86335 RepID=A0AAV0UCU1_9STRA|nr:unnamed protein product [Peronospora destructor]
MQQFNFSFVTELPLAFGLGVAWYKYDKMKERQFSEKDATQWNEAILRMHPQKPKKKIKGWLPGLNRLILCLVPNVEHVSVTLVTMTRVFYEWRRTPLLVAAGVGAAAWYMVSKRDMKTAPPPDRDPRAPPSKMK